MTTLFNLEHGRYKARESSNYRGLFSFEGFLQPSINIFRNIFFIFFYSFAQDVGMPSAGSTKGEKTAQESLFFHYLNFLLHSACGGKVSACAPLCNPHTNMLFDCF